MAVQVRSTAAPGGGEAQQHLPQALHGGNPDHPGDESQNQPHRNGNACQDIAGFLPTHGAEGGLVHLPGGDNGENAKNQAQQHLQRHNGGHVHGQADAAEHLAGAENIPVNFPPPLAGFADGALPRDHARGAAQGFGIGEAGGIDDPLLPKEAAEGADLKETPLVAHIHALVQQDSAPVGLDEDIAHLGPAQDHHAKVAPV